MKLNKYTNRITEPSRQFYKILDDLKKDFVGKTLYYSKTEDCQTESGNHYIKRTDRNNKIKDVDLRLCCHGFIDRPIIYFFTENDEKVHENSVIEII
jgi:hypothetical protein